MPTPSVSGREVISASRDRKISVRGPLRVLHVGSGNLYGGVETILVTLARLRHLCPDMIPHFALSYEGRVSQELIASNVPLHLLGNVRISRPWTVWRARRRLRELLQRQAFDVVICHMPWTMAVFGKAVRAAECPLAFWAHDAATGRHWLERLARHAAPDLLIANSRFTEASIVNFLPIAVHGIVYPPMPVTTGMDSEESRGEARRELGVAEGTVVIIQVSRMEEWKGHLSHLAALAQLKGIGAPWTCWMIGGPQRSSEHAYLRRLQKAVSDLGIAGRVRFLGQRNDVPRLLAAADVFCQPNESPEPFGIVFVEALRAGCPVVSTAMGGAIEVVDDSCGILVPRKDPALVAEALRRLIDSPDFRARLGRAGPVRARRLCDPEVQMQRLADLCRNVAATR
jgi:glycosyltransferase involved in cell wall biosynthesis